MNYYARYVAMAYCVNINHSNVLKIGLGWCLDVYLVSKSNINKTEFKNIRRGTN